MLSFPTKPSHPTEHLTLDEVERRHIMYVLDVCDQQRTRAARILGIDRKTLYRRLLAYGVVVGENEAPRHDAAASRHSAAM